MWSHIPQNQVNISSTRYEELTFLEECFGKSFGVLDHLGRVFFEGWRHDLLHLDGDCTNLSVVGTTLAGWEHCEVDCFREFLSHEDNAASRSSQRFVRSRCDNIAEWERIIKLLGCNQTTNVSNISH